MANVANSTTLIGRLAADLKTFQNADGSKKVLGTLMIDRNFQNAKGETESDAIPFEAFIRKTVEGTGPYAYMHKGDQVAISASLRQDRYTGKDGREVYALKVVAEDVTFLESRSVTQARLAARTAQPAAAAVAVAEPAVATEVESDLPF